MKTSFLDACSNLSSIANTANANWERSVRKTSFFFVMLCSVVCTFSRISRVYTEIEEYKHGKEKKKRVESKSAFFQKHHILTRYVCKSILCMEMKFKLTK